MEEDLVALKRITKGLATAIVEAQSEGSASHCPFCGAYNLSGFKTMYKEGGNSSFSPHKEGCIVFIAKKYLRKTKKKINH